MLKNKGSFLISYVFSSHLIYVVYSILNILFSCAHYTRQRS